jgi:hypothetical protein
MRPPTYQYVRTLASAHAITAYGAAQVIPVVCERCNDVEFVCLPSDIDVFCRLVREIGRAHKRCQFYPIQYANDEWCIRWGNAFRWIASSKRRPHESRES